MTGQEARELATTWRARARHLEAQAARWRADGDSEYAEELEQAAQDNRRAAARLEGTVPA